MRVVLQRVLQANVKVDNKIVGNIKKGLLVLLGVGADDNEKDVEYLAEKIVGLRIFEDNNDKMNLSVKDVGGELLVVSQFTIYGDCRKGRRPSFTKAGNPTLAKTLYDMFVDKCVEKEIKVETGVFQADMNIELVNNGPVTFIIDSKE